MVLLSGFLLDLDGGWSCLSRILFKLVYWIGVESEEHGGIEVKQAECRVEKVP